MLTRSLEAAMSQADYEKLEDGTWMGRIPACPGVVAFAKSRRACHIELRSVLEDWVLLGIRSGDPLPVIDEINLNQKTAHEPMGSV